MFTKMYAIYCVVMGAAMIFLSAPAMTTLSAIYLCALWAMSVWAISAVIEMTIEEEVHKPGDPKS